MRGLVAVLRDRPAFAALLGCTVVHAVAIGCLLAGTPYFARTTLGDADLIGGLVAAFVLPSLLATPAWRRLGARRGPRAGLVLSSLLFAAGCLLLLLTPALPTPCALGVMLVAGTGHAGQLLFGYSMLAECTAADAARTGHSRAGTLSGLFSAGETAGLALGPFLFALALQLSGYASSGTGRTAEQSGTALAGVLVGVAVLPALAVCAGLLWLCRHRRPDHPESRSDRPESRIPHPGDPAVTVHPVPSAAVRGALRQAGPAARARP